MCSSNSISTKVSKSKLGQAVRHGRCGSDPRLVPEFIRSESMASAEQTRDEQWQVQVEIVGLLFETVADPLLANCWRNWCLQCCCMPMHTLRCLSLTQSENNKTKKLQMEMSALKEYYLPQM